MAVKVHIFLYFCVIMDAEKKRTITAAALITVSLALLAAAVWLFLAHRPPMPQGPPPGGPSPGGPVPGGPGPGGRPPMMIEEKMAIISAMVVCMTLCVVSAVRILRRRPAPSLSAAAPDAIRFKVDYKTVTVPLADIRYIESMSEYVKIFLEGREEPLVVLYSLKRLEQELPSSRFIRIHRSYIVALDRVRASSATTAVLDGDVILPVGASYRAAFRSYFPAR